MTGFKHPKCFANQLGGCSTKISREHYVSKAVLELVEYGDGHKSKTVRVKGLGFQETSEVEEFGIGDLRAKILCETHNRMLSPYDSEGMQAFRAIEQVVRAAETHDKTPKVLTVDGDRLERWFLKVMLGGLISRNFVWNEMSRTARTEVPVHFLELLFNGLDFVNERGLYWMHQGVSEKIRRDQGVLGFGVFFVQMGANVGEFVYGFRVDLFGFQFGLLLADITPGATTAFDLGMYRPPGIEIEPCETRVEFTWKGGARSNMVRLRYDP